MSVCMGVGVGWRQRQVDTEPAETDWREFWIPMLFSFSLNSVTCWGLSQTCRGLTLFLAMHLVWTLLSVEGPQSPSVACPSGGWAVAWAAGAAQFSAFTLRSMGLCEAEIPKQVTVYLFSWETGGETRVLLVPSQGPLGPKIHKHGGKNPTIIIRKKKINQ